jgi:phage shock protein A
MSQRTVDELTRVSESAAEAERHLEQTVRALETELEQAREQLAQARRDAYRAEQRRKKAADELGRSRE